MKTIGLFAVLFCLAGTALASDLEKFEEYLMECRFEKAEQFCAARQESDQPALYRKLADKYFFDGFWGRNEGYLEKARDCYLRAGETPAEVDAVFASAFFQYGDFQRAMNHFEQQGDTHWVNLCKVGMVSKRYGKQIYREILLPTLAGTMDEGRYQQQFDAIQQTCDAIHPRLFLLSLFSVRNILKQNAYDSLYLRNTSPVFVVLSNHMDNTLQAILVKLDNPERDADEQKKMEKLLNGMMEQTAASEPYTGEKK